MVLEALRDFTFVLAEKPKYDLLSTYLKVRNVQKKKGSRRTSKTVLLKGRVIERLSLISTERGSRDAAYAAKSLRWSVN